MLRNVLESIGSHHQAMGLFLRLWVDFGHALLLEQQGDDAILHFDLLHPLLLFKFHLILILKRLYWRIYVLKIVKQNSFS